MKSGFVALAGRPNAGKSTLINALVKEKIAIVSDRPQTTRSEIRGIRTDEDSQIIFTDTPGIHKAQYRLGVRMNKQAADVIQGVDLIYLVVDGSVPYGKGDAFVLQMVANTGLPVFLILNKCDKGYQHHSHRRAKDDCQENGQQHHVYSFRSFTYPA